MKKMVKVFLVTGICLLGLASYGQFGVKAGLGVSSTLSKDNDTNFGKEFLNYKPGLALHVGLGYEIDFSDMVSVEPALMFARRSFTADFQDQRFKYKFNYIEMPVNVKVYFMELGDNKLYGLAGGYVGYLLSGKLDAEKLDIGNKEEDDTKPLDAGINFGVGIQLFEALNVDLSGSIGVTNLSNFQTNGYKDNHRVFRLTVTYQFGG